MPWKTVSQTLHFSGQISSSLQNFSQKTEISEIWITFPDPQMKKVRKRLTSTRFMDLYRQILKPDGIIHLKSDSNFMYTYTCEMIKANHYPVNIQTDDLYNSDITDEILEIKTFYEQQWLERGLSTNIYNLSANRDPFSSNPKSK